MQINMRKLYSKLPGTHYEVANVLSHQHVLYRH